MPTAEWREEKSENVVQSICRVLASSDLPQEARHELGSDALWNALKLHADALQERMGGTRWSPGLVDLFREQPAKCNDWLALMQEQDFTAAAYFKEL
ncbi:hypothetical protein ACJBUE_12700 [Ralstonia syzygii subsp. celebesensis]|uniref:hypothetical protein n=1 Tax=Ralstonia syzygii TaxID=28097 RepID=UPI00387E1CEB